MAVYSKHYKKAAVDDGEAATIAFAVIHSAVTVPVIDERKATRIFKQRWANCVAIGTMALMSDTRVADGLSQEQLREAVHSALRHEHLLSLDRSGFARVLLLLRIGER